MPVRRLMAATLVWAAAAAPARADVTLRFRGSGQMLGTEAQEATEYRKGLKQRTDSSHAGMSVSSIIDVGAGRMIILWHHRKTAEVIERKQISELLPSSVPVVPPSITPTTQSRQIAGWTCIVHHVTGAYAMRPMDMVPPTMVMQGSICLVRNGPGQADFTAFYQALGKSQPVPDPTLGVPFATEMTIGFRGEDPTAEVREMGTYTTEVISVSTDPIPDSLFDIPAGYSVTKR